LGRHSGVSGAQRLERSQSGELRLRRWSGVGKRCRRLDAVFSQRPSECAGEAPEISCALIFWPIFIIPRGPRDNAPPPTCEFSPLKKGDDILGGYPKKGRGDLANFDPNETAHGGHDTGDGIIKDELVQFYYYFEVLAKITGGIGNQSDWHFNQRLVETGTYTLDLGNGRTETHTIGPEGVRDPDNPIRGNFVWNDQGYHYLDTPSFRKLITGNGGKVHPLIGADVTLTFTLTGYHMSNGRRDATCPAKTFTLKFHMKNSVAGWD